MNLPIELFNYILTFTQGATNKIMKDEIKRLNRLKTRFGVESRYNGDICIMWCKLSLLGRDGSYSIPNLALKLKLTTRQFRHLKDSCFNDYLLFYEEKTPSYVKKDNKDEIIKILQVRGIIKKYIL